jgi:ankyrin repeat protein
LIGAVSLGAEKVSRVLIEAGAQLEKTSVFGARALHWAAWMGAAATVDLLIKQGAGIEFKCSEFGATPLFWAVHGYGPDGPKQKQGQVAAARILIQAGAQIDTANKHGVSALQMAASCVRSDMHVLLREHSGRSV